MESLPLAVLARPPQFSLAEPVLGCHEVEMACESAACGHRTSLFVRGSATVAFCRTLSANCQRCGRQMRAVGIAHPGGHTTSRIKPV